MVSAAPGFVAVQDVAQWAAILSAAAAGGASATAATESGGLLTVVVDLYGWEAEQASYFAAVDVVVDAAAA